VPSPHLQTTNGRSGISSYLKDGERKTAPIPSALSGLALVSRTGAAGLTESRAKVPKRALGRDTKSVVP